MHRIALAALVTLLAMPDAARALCVERLPFVGIAQRVDLVAVVRVEHVEGTLLHARVERVLAGASGLKGERIVIGGGQRMNDYPPDGPTPGSRWAIALGYSLVRYDSIWIPPSYCATAVLRVEGEEAIGGIVGCDFVHGARTEMGLTATTEGQRMSIDELQEKIRSATDEARCDPGPPDAAPYPGVPRSRTVTGIVLDAHGKPRAGVDCSLSTLGVEWEAQVRTDAGGRFRVDEVPPHSLWITCRRGTIAMVAPGYVDHVRLVERWRAP